MIRARGRPVVRAARVVAMATMLLVAAGAPPFQNPTARVFVESAAATPAVREDHANPSRASSADRQTAGQRTDQRTGQAPGMLGAAASGKLVGSVVDGLNGDPVEDALVTLAQCTFAPPIVPTGWPFAEAGSCVAARAGMQVRTDSNGRFQFNAAPATYLVSVEGPGYVTQQFGQRTFPGEGRPVAITAGTERSPLQISLARSSRVRGVVRDTALQPVEGVPVEIMRVAYDAMGERFSDVVGAGVTRADGAYEIAGLAPGEYAVAVGTPWRPVAPGQPREHDGNILFHPGVASLDAATRIVVGPGSETTLGETTLPVERYSIRGTLRRAGAAPGADVAIEVAAVPPDVRLPRYRLSSSRGVIRGDAFEIPNLSVGTYLIRGLNGSAVGEPVEVTIANSDVNEVEVRLPEASPGAVTLEGHWRVDAATSLPSPMSLSPCEEGIRLALVRTRLLWPVFTGEGPEPESPWLNRNGTFEFHPAPGEYRLRLLCPNPGIYLKEVRLDGRDVLGERLTMVTSQHHVLDVVFGLKAATVDVSIAVSSNVAGSRVILAPDDPARTDLFQSGLADADGRIRFVGVAPGSYYAFAVAALPPFGYFDPALLSLARSWARDVTANPGMTIGVAITLSAEGSASLPSR